MERQHWPTSHMIETSTIKLESAITPEGPRQKNILRKAQVIQSRAQFRATQLSKRRPQAGLSQLKNSPTCDPMDGTKVMPKFIERRATAITNAKTDTDADPAIAAALSVRDGAWIETIDEQEWLNAVWWS